eukprot:10559868-Heterocapsa_arctica.AAC.1
MHLGRQSLRDEVLAGRGETRRLVLQAARLRHLGCPEHARVRVEWAIHCQAPGALVLHGGVVLEER